MSTETCRQVSVDSSIRCTGAFRRSGPADYSKNGKVRNYFSRLFSAKSRSLSVLSIRELRIVTGVDKSAVMQSIDGWARKTKLSSLAVRISLAAALAWSGCAGERKLSGFGTLLGLGAGRRDLGTLRSGGSAAVARVAGSPTGGSSRRLRGRGGSAPPFGPAGYPQDAEVRLFLGDVLISAGRPEEALKWLAPLAAESGAGWKSLLPGSLGLRSTRKWRTSSTSLRKGPGVRTHERSLPG